MSNTKTIHCVLTLKKVNHKFHNGAQKHIVTDIQYTISDDITKHTDAHVIGNKVYIDIPARYEESLVDNPPYNPVVYASFSIDYSPIIGGAKSLFARGYIHRYNNILSKIDKGIKISYLTSTGVYPHSVIEVRENNPIDFGVVHENTRFEKGDAFFYILNGEIY